MVISFIRADDVTECSADVSQILDHWFNYKNVYE